MLLDVDNLKNKSILKIPNSLWLYGAKLKDVQKFFFIVSQKKIILKIKYAHAYSYIFPNDDELTNQFRSHILEIVCYFEDKEEKRQKTINLYRKPKYRINEKITKYLKKGFTYKEIQNRLNVGPERIAKISKRLKNKVISNA